MKHKIYICIISLSPCIEMLELKGWAMNSGRKYCFPEEFFTQNKKGERQRNEAKGIFFRTTLSLRDFLCPKEEKEVRREVNVQVGKVVLFFFPVTVLYYFN